MSETTKTETMKVGDRLSMTVCIRVGDIVPVKVPAPGLFDQDREAEVLGITQDGKVMGRLLDPDSPDWRVFHLTGVKLETRMGNPLKWVGEVPSAKAKAQEEAVRVGTMQEQGLITTDELASHLFGIIHDLED